MSCLVMEIPSTTKSQGLLIAFYMLFVDFGLLFKKKNL